MGKETTPPYLLVSTSSGNRKLLLSSGSSWTIGRDSNNHLIIREPWISRNHAIIQKTKEHKFRISDLGSSNGSYVNGQRIKGSVILGNHAQIFLGRTKIEFHSPSNLSYSEVDERKHNETVTSMFHKRHLLSAIVVELCDVDSLVNRLDHNIFSMVIDEWFAQTKLVFSQQKIVVNKSMGNSLIGIWFHEHNEPKLEEFLNIFQALIAIYHMTSKLIDKYFLPFSLKIRAVINTGIAMVKNEKDNQGNEHEICGDLIDFSFYLKSIIKIIKKDIILGEKTYFYFSQMSLPKDIFEVTNNIWQNGSENESFYTADFKNLVRSFPDVEVNHVNKSPQNHVKNKSPQNHVSKSPQNHVNKSPQNHVDKYSRKEIKAEFFKDSIFQGHADWITSVCFSPNGKTFATASWDNRVKIWNLNKEEIQIFKHNDMVNHVCFNPDGKTLATASWDKTAKLWSVEGKEIRSLQHRDLVNSVCFSPDGQILATSSLDQTIKMFSLKGENIRTIVGHEASVLSVCFSPDGQIIASAGMDGTVKLWNFKGQKIKTILAHEAAVIGISFSPDGQTLLTGSWDQTAKLWSLKGKKLQVFQHEDLINSACFSPDGQVIATASKDKTIKLWSVDSKLLRKFKHEDIINSVSFSPDGKIIAACDCSGRIILLCNKNP